MRLPSSFKKILNTDRIVQFLSLALAIPTFALIFHLNVVFVNPAINELSDFGSFIASGKLASNGENPYSIDSPLIHNILTQDSNETVPSPNLNPPISVLLFQAFNKLDPFMAVTIWRIATFIQYLIALVLLAVVYPKQITPFRLLWALNLAGIWNTLALGQIYASLLVLGTVSWLLMEKGYYKLAGVSLGLIVAFKPNFAFWLLLLGTARYFTVFLSSAITAAALWILPYLVFGLQIYKQWITALSEYPSRGLLIAGNSSFQSLSARFGFFAPGTILALMLVGISIYFTYRNKDSLRPINSLGILGSMLISPFAWPGYTILSLPIFISRPHWNWQFTLSAFLLMFPYLIVMYFLRDSLFTSVFFGWIYGWGLLLILTEVLIDFRREREAHHNEQE